MRKLEKYIISNLSILFFSMLLPLFTIASIVFLIKLSTATAVIDISAFEMFKLYLFVFPEILFYTMPLTFFVAASLAIYKLSTDNEMVVLFSLGINPNIIIKILFKPALFLSILTLFNYLLIYPHTKVLSDNFIEQKKSNAQLNLSASEFGNKFGEWLVFIEKNNPDGSYEDVVLFKKTDKEEIIIGAKRAEIINEANILKLELFNGKGYNYSKNKFSEISFKEMNINNKLDSDYMQYRSAYGYWTSEEKHKRKKTMLVVNTMFSLFPIFSLFLVASIGIVHARHQKGMTYLYIFLGILAYYGATLSLEKTIGFYTIPLVFSVWISITYFIYKRKVLSRF